MGDDWVAVDACTLPTAERPLRVAEFDALFAANVTDVRRRGSTGVRLALVGPQGLRERVQDLAHRETECCSFFTFSLSASDLGDRDSTEAERLSLDVDVPTERTDVLDALADRARRLARTEARP
jgi:hypothetical protein